jgi:putative transposase
VPHFWPILPEVGLFAWERKFRHRESSKFKESENTDNSISRLYRESMPWSLKRFHQTGALHFITWSCFDRQPLLGKAEHRDLLLKVLEQMRNRYQFGVVGFVVMPEHVHVLMSEPLIGSVSSAICAVKLGFTRRVLSEKPHLWQNRPEVGHPCDEFKGRHFWMKRYYDFNVFSSPKISEKLHYMHQNPVTRGLVERPEDWPWSSFLFYACGKIGPVKINDWSRLKGKIRSTAS